MPRRTSALAWAGLLVLLALSVTACSRTAAPSMPAVTALPGVARGEIVYQASDGSIQAVQSDGSNDRRVSVLPTAAVVTRPTEILGWCPQRGLVAYSRLTGNGAIGSFFDSIQVLDLASGRVTTQSGAEGIMACTVAAEVAFSQDGSEVVYQSAGNAGPRVMDTASGRTRHLEGDVTTDPAVFSWQWGPPKERNARLAYPTVPSRVSSRIVAASPDSRTLAIGRGNGDVSMFDVTKNRWMATMVRKPNTWWLHVTFSPDSARVVLEDDHGGSEYGQARLTRIWVARSDGTGLTRIATGTAPACWLGR